MSSMFGFNMLSFGMTGDSDAQDSTPQKSLDQKRTSDELRDSERARRDAFGAERQEEESAMDLSRLSYGTAGNRSEWCFMRNAPENACIILPDSVFGQAWDITMFLWILYVCFGGTFEFAFVPMIELNAWFWVNRVADAFFFVDIVKNFRTTYRLDDETGTSRTKMYETDPHRIAITYLKEWFAPDLLATIPWDLITYAFEQSLELGEIGILKFLRMLRLLKLVRMVRGLRIVQVLQVRANLDYDVLTITKLIAIFILFAHWLACLWHVVTDFEDSDVNWLTQYGVADSSRWPQYTVSLFWSIQTITTIGYGEVQTATDAERWMAIIGMFLGAATYASIVAMATTVIINKNLEDQVFRMDLRILNTTLANHNIPLDLQLRARGYYHAVHKLKTDRKRLKQVLSSVSPILYAEISGHVYHGTVQSCWMLRDASFEICSEIGSSMEMHCWSRGDKVHRAGEYINDLQVVVQGLIPTRTQLGKMVFRSDGPLSEDVFGPSDVNIPTMHNAFVASQYAATLMVSKNDLFNVIKFDRHLCKRFRRYALFTVMKKAAYVRRLISEGRLETHFVALPEDWSHMIRDKSGHMPTGGLAIVGKKRLDSKRDHCIAGTQTLGEITSEDECISTGPRAQKKSMAPNPLASLVGGSHRVCC